MRFSLFITSLLAFPAIVFAFDPSDQDDSLALVRHFVEVETPLEMQTEEGLVGDQAGLTVSLMGGADVFRMQKFGYLEALLQHSHPDWKLRFRNLGWSADTVYRQQRPMFFYTEKGDTREGSLPDRRERVEPGILILSFGKMESLDGLDRLGEFEEAYDRLVGELQRFSKRIVLVEPVPFAEKGPASSLAAERNEVLAKYTEAIRSIAEKRGAKVAGHTGFPDSAFERNGIHLSAVGLAEWANSVAAAFGGIEIRCPVGEDNSEFEELRKEVVEKNHLWNQYYRPTNWAFLFGDRQHVPSSRDHENSDRRWFVEEMEMIPSLMLDSESRIWSAAKGGDR